MAVPGAELRNALGDVSPAGTTLMGLSIAKRGDDWDYCAQDVYVSQIFAKPAYN